MDRFHFIKANLGFGIAGLTGTNINSNFNYLFNKEELIKIWQISGALTLEFADAMPSVEYGFRPAGPDSMYTYGRQMQHIAENNIRLLSRYLTDKPPPDIRETEIDDKPAIMANIRASIDYGTEIIRGLNAEKLGEEVKFFARPLPRWYVLFVAQDHTTHHCGQAVVYLNAKGIKPPSYQKW